uniref:BEACH-type PH domain-containing protein n=1 Tax=Macrostomum lignano TaxID=282301 RepID=A0A1I8FI41_9PLAT
CAEARLSDQWFLNIYLDRQAYSQRLTIVFENILLQAGIDCIMELEPAAASSRICSGQRSSVSPNESGLPGVSTPPSHLGHKPIAVHYGNGFKSGSMRIGKDAIVFTKTRLATMPRSEFGVGTRRCVSEGGDIVNSETLQSIAPACRHAAEDAAVADFCVPLIRRSLRPT